MKHRDTISNCLNIGTISGSAIVDTSSNENTFIFNNFYDKQMIPNSFGMGFNDIAGQAEGKLTTQLTGTSPELVITSYSIHYTKLYEGHVDG